MIACIRGTLIEKSATQIIIDAGGIGYRVFVPLTTFYELPETGQSIQIHTHTHVREDAIHLFGFHTYDEKEIFESMISVSGIGPKLAINILSGITARELASAISGGNVSRLLSIPGVGRKTAERMILELKDKLNKLIGNKDDHAKAGLIPNSELMLEDAISALVNLGYKGNAVRGVLEDVMQSSTGQSLTLDLLLKQALKALAG